MVTETHGRADAEATPALEVGFGGASLWGCWAAHKPLADEIDVRVIVLRQGAVVAAMVVGDLCTLSLEVALGLRGAIAAALSIPEDHVGVFVTQNHATSSDMKTFDLATLEARFLQATRAAAANLTPVEMATIAVHPSPPLNVCRRIHLEGYGAFTFYFGYNSVDGRPECSHLLKLALKGLAEGKPYVVRSCDIEHGKLADYQATVSPVAVPGRLPFPPAADDLVQAIFFRSMRTPAGIWKKPSAGALFFSGGHVEISPASSGSGRLRHHATSALGWLTWRSGRLPTPGGIGRRNCGSLRRW